MKLAEILEGCDSVLLSDALLGQEERKCLLESEISGITYDSRSVTEGAVFVAVQGENADGHDFAADALSRGARAVVAERLPRAVHPSSRFIRVPDSRKALACLANNFYRRPSEECSVIGVTGTNGKTTTTYLIKAILEEWNRGVGLIGTVRYLIRDKEYHASHTTPEAPEFQGLLRSMVSEGCAFVVTEVSSHALAQKRVDSTRFAAAVFTNLTRDHLDFHGTMEAYYDAKRRLFRELLSEDGIAVINADDPWGGRLIRETPGRVVTFGTGADADVTAEGIAVSFTGLSFRLRERTGETTEIVSPYIGRANVSNILAASAAALALGVPREAIQRGVRTVAPVTGRLEKIDEGQDFLCIVDYAHTPDALERLILTARELIGSGGQGSIITVFGCGGNRDRGKRPIMGEIATRLSDAVVITSDNPRREDPLDIIGEIEKGVSKNNYVSIPDRKEAIAHAVEQAGGSDILIVAGKGHEAYQEIGDKRFPFSDREITRHAIRERLKRTPAAWCTRN